MGLCMLDTTLFRAISFMLLKGKKKELGLRHTKDFLQGHRTKAATKNRIHDLLLLSSPHSYISYLPIYNICRRKSQSWSMLLLSISPSLGSFPIWEITRWWGHRTFYTITIKYPELWDLVLMFTNSRCSGWPELKLMPQFPGCYITLGLYHTTPPPDLEKLYAVVIISRKWPKFFPTIAPGDRALRETPMQKLTFSWHLPTVTQSGIMSLERAQNCFLLCLPFLPAFIGIWTEGCFSFCTYLYLAWASC